MGRGKNRFKIRDLFAILDFLRTTKVGRRVGPRVAAAETGRGLY